MRGTFPGILWLACFLIPTGSCAESSKEAPVITSIDPNEVPRSARTPADVHGRNFFGEVYVDLDSDSPPRLDRRFRVVIGDTLLPEADVTFIDTQTLSITIPDSLEVKVHDLSVTTPAGQVATLPEALTVYDCIPESEGPTGDASCFDGTDNDCDGLTDLAETDCTGSYRRQITVTAGSAPVPPEYSVSFVLDHAALVLEGKSLADGADVRIFAGEASASVELDRVLDENSSWNSPDTQIWFKLPGSLDAGQSRNEQHVYYGNLDAGNPLADHDRVFVFHDDFETSGLDRWNLQIDGVWELASDQARSGSHSLKGHPAFEVHKWITARDVDESDLLVSAYWRMSSMNSMDLSQAFRTSAAPPIYHYETNLESHHGDSNGWDIAKMINDEWTEILNQPPGQNPQANQWTRITIIIVGTRMKVLRSGSQIAPPSGWTEVGPELSSGSIGFRIWRIPDGQAWWIDDVLARKYTDPEPTTSLGPEEPVP